ncbi:MAG TPA: antitoxin Xre-like helix-turn-helix domain-containing protein [Thermoanaerobaculia bacterium]|jgi:putative toxin-antitoxin system antitoxin component (TIGR02293 family)|nr:antitoxin Xre-like helix-turn-helix domain-containing protein [Thermoanaerobaculia bacterium]
MSKTYEDLISVTKGNWLQQLNAAKKGLPFSRLERLRDMLGLTLAETGAIIGMSPRTVARRKEEGRLDLDESTRLMRVAQLIKQAMELLQNHEPSVRGWMTHGNPALGGARPIDLMRTEIGARAVETLIFQILDGIGF